MDIISALLLVLSASFASGRNVLSKSFASFSFKYREFFRLQASVFGAGCVLLLIVNAFSFKGLSIYTLLVGLIYGVILMCAQWFYTIALSHGKTAICATIYSFGFLIPTISGAMFWDEKITICGFIGILVAMATLVISGINKKAKSEDKTTNSYFLPLIIALICSGALGVVQKIQQGSDFSNQTNSFVLVAFALCFAVSLVLSLVLKKGPCEVQSKNVICGSVIGAFFATCNLLNTYLAGKLESAVFFPAINIGSILFSLILGLIIYKEKPTKKDILTLILSITSIILVNF